jgi:phosphotransferase system enzyme I (PtsI)
MVETVDELLILQKMVEQARQSLEREGVQYQRSFKQGVLIEIPSAIWTLKELLERTDFASVGTNDLLQYHFAVDRGNANVNHLYRPEHPSVLRMLKRISDIASESGKRITLCGEMAADPKLAPLLFGLGFSNLSVDVHSIDSVRRAVPEGSGIELKALAERSLAVSTSDDVRTIMAEFNNGDIAMKPNSDVPEYGIVDPVCGMVVDSRDNPYSLVMNGESHFFCSRACLQSYIENRET